jgi:predicted DsbA family dithiol-disulfide isomerase
MTSFGARPSPSHHTPPGGVLIGSSGARRRLLIFEDPQCPYCQQFEDVSGDMLRREVSAGAVAVEYRMRGMLGPGSVRADNALALAAEEDRFDQLRVELFRAQPPEGEAEFTTELLIELGRRAGLVTPHYVEGVREGRYEDWARHVEEQFQEEDPNGTPAAFLDGAPIPIETLYDPEALGALVRG